ncbi:ATP-dependent endonuclease [Streptomyces goshikiensis]|uniref:ATP-dependent nuclease n=1 Tax=Streptomyces goshikiensis TaxID=1942 RepID=UPI003647B8E3
MGKSNLGRIIDLGSNLLGLHASRDAGQRQWHADQLGLLAQAGRLGAERFDVALGIELDQAWERELLVGFLRACFVGSVGDGPHPEYLLVQERTADALISVESTISMYSGVLRIAHDASLSSPWYAAWEFISEASTYHVTLVGNGSGSLYPGPANPHQVLDSTSLLRRFEELNGGLDPMRQSISQRFHSGEVAAEVWEEDMRQLQESQTDLRSLLPGLQEAIHLQVGPAADRPIRMPACTRSLATALGVVDAEQHSFSFVQVFQHIFRRGVVVTDNRRLPLQRRFAATDLMVPFDLRDGSAVAGELFRLKNGEGPLQQRYERVADLFSQLTARTFALHAKPDPDDSFFWIIDVQITANGHEGPAAFAGAGVQETLLLSLLAVGEPGRFLLLDEPAIHLEPTLQRRLITRLSANAQCLVTTHSADLVPVSTAADLSKIIRLAPSPSGTRIFRSSADLSGQERSKWLHRLGASEARSMLFAAGVVLCEGATEVGALGEWWESPVRENWIGPGAANVILFDVGGDQGFGPYIDFLQAFGIPWAIVADGPALEPGSTLHEYLDGQKMIPGDPPSDDGDFGAWKAYWWRAGVHTVANTFGTDGSKSGEFEAWLVALDRKLYERAKTDVGGRSKPRTGAEFARRSGAPSEVLDMYEHINLRLAAGTQMWGTSE